MKKYENGELPHHEQTQINQWVEEGACTNMYHKERLILYEFYSIFLFYILSNIDKLCSEMAFYKYVIRLLVLNY